MDMGTGKRDSIAAAIAALPYKAPPAGFKGRVLAAIAARAAARRRLDWAVKGLAALTASWTALLGLAAAGPLYRCAADYAPLALEPGGVEQVLKLLGARAALLAGKGAAALAAARELGRTVFAYLPPAHEIFVAALICAAVISMAAVRRTAEQKV